MKTAFCSFGLLMAAVRVRSEHWEGLYCLY